jgi:hypothetical protein
MESDEAEGWKGGIIKEFNNFLKRKVYKITKRNEVPKGKKILKTRWVFRTKTKEDGTKIYRSRGVVKGYDQIPGVDFTESFAPTANDTTLRTMLAITLSKSKEGWTVEVIDIETAFLEADLKEQVWIEVPQGYEFAFGEIDRETHVMLLLKAMYGLVQAPRAFYETFRKILTSSAVGMSQSKVDPCLFYIQTNGKITAMMVIHVDDCAIAGKKETVAEIKKAIAKQLSIKDEGCLSKHLGVSYEWNSDGSLMIRACQ